MKKIKYISYLLSSVVVSSILSSCDITREPFGSLSSDKITSDPSASIEALVNGAYTQLKGWSDPMHRCGEYAGDNMMIRGASTDAFYEFISYSRTPNNYRLQSFWDAGYKAIAQASNVIDMIKEGQSTDIDNKLGECYYIRGMMYFYLCRTYGRPYYQAPDKNLGVPIVNGTPKDMDNLQLPDRSTVKDTYAQAIKDLESAERLMTEDQGPDYASKEAAEAMLSRIYLYMSGTYENPNTEYAQKAIEYAQKVINSGKYSLLSRSEYMVSNTLAPENNKEDIFVIKRIATDFPDYDYYYTIGGMYSNIGGMGWGEMYASQKYIDLLNETGRNDWRPDSKKIVDARANFIEPQYEEDETTGKYTNVFRFVKQTYGKDGKANGYQYVQADLTKNGSSYSCSETVDEKTTTYAMTPVADQTKYPGMYTIKYSDGQTYTGVIDYKMLLNRVYPEFYIVKCSREAGTESQLHSPIISRLDEMYLNMAEAYAKLGNYGSALTNLNIIRERSIPGAGYTSLDASNAQERIDKERQLELAYQAERSYDVYRNGGTLTRRYPNGAAANIEDIPATDYRVTYYIPQTAINSYPDGSTLTQNPTSNAGVILK